MAIVDIHTDPYSRKQYTVGPSGELVPYPPEAPVECNIPLSQAPQLPPLADFQQLIWKEQRAIAQSHGLGDKPEGQSWEEFVIEKLYGGEQ